MAYLQANSTIALCHLELFKRLALQCKCELAAMTASVISLYGRLSVSRLRTTWRLICGLKLRALVIVDLQRLKINILNRADLVLIDRCFLRWKSPSLRLLQSPYLVGP